MGDLRKEQDYIFDVIRGERKYQDTMIKKEDRPDMVEALHVGDTLTAMQYNLDLARQAWYHGSAPHEGAMGFIRKICGLGVQAGESYGMPKRVIEDEDQPKDTGTRCRCMKGCNCNHK